MIEEQKVIDLSNYENFWNMLSSSDKENSVVALSILDKAPFRESLPYILLLLKTNSTGHDNIESWKEHAPNLIKLLEGMGITPGGNISYKLIIDKTKEHCPSEAVQFVLDKFSLVLKGYLIDWGIEFIEDMEIKLKFKKDVV